MSIIHVSETAFTSAHAFHPILMAANVVAIAITRRHNTRRGPLETASEQSAMATYPTDTALHCPLSDAVAITTARTSVSPNSADLPIETRHSTHIGSLPVTSTSSDTGSSEAWGVYTALVSKRLKTVVRRRSTTRAIKRTNRFHTSWMLIQICGGSSPSPSSIRESESGYATDVTKTAAAKRERKICMQLPTVGAVFGNASNTIPAMRSAMANVDGSSIDTRISDPGYRIAVYTNRQARSTTCL